MDRPEELEFAWLMLIGISLTFLLSLAVVLFFVYYQRRMFANRAAMEALRREEQEKRLKAVIAAQEQERSRIAQDLHDEVGVMLSTVKLYITHERKGPGTGKAEDLLDEAVTTLRRIARNLSPEHLARFGFERALDDLCRPVEESDEISITRDIQLAQRLPLEQEIQLHRMVQELLNNTLKHAGASAIRIQLHEQEAAITLSYEDNGRGFNLDEVEGLPSLGLRTLSGRVEVLNGQLQLKSEPGQGFQASVTIPRQVTNEPVAGLNGSGPAMNGQTDGMKKRKSASCFKSPP